MTSTRVARPAIAVRDALRPVIDGLFPDGLPIAIRMWDDSVLGPSSSAADIVVRSPMALRRMLWAPGELGLARAYVAGDIDIDGDIFAALAIRDHLGARGEARSLTPGPTDRLHALIAATRLGALGPPPRPPAEEAHLKGRRHGRSRDAAAVAHHYDISDDFYRLVLGPTMTYSCAYFDAPDVGVDRAQEAKYELICRKLDLREGQRLLDVGCGWGGMVLHAAANHGVHAVGVTVSAQQAKLARRRVAQRRLEDRVTIRLQDYRDVDDGPYDAISSIGMFEHVGLAQLDGYFRRLRGLLTPRGRLLNHGISRPPGGSGPDHRSFVDRYVFPDGELHEVGSVVTAIQAQGFEVRDVESLREHYAQTLRAWVANLTANWTEAVDLVGAGRARIWQLYLAGSALAFDAGRVNIHQILAVVPDRSGSAGMPRTRNAWLDPVDNDRHVHRIASSDADH